MDITPDAVRAAVLAYRTAIDNAALVVETATPPPPVDAVKQVPTIIALPILGALISHAVVDTLMLKDAKARAAVFNSLVLEQAPAAMRGLIEAGAAAVDKFYRNGRKRKTQGTVQSSNIIPTTAGTPPTSAVLAMAAVLHRKRHTGGRGAQVVCNYRPRPQLSQLGAF